MCGIAGFITKEPFGQTSELLKGLSKSIQHRGPDDFGFLGWSETNQKPQLSKDPSQISPSQVHFVHRRLSIIDLTDAGWQPMSDQSGRYFITYNGEIYNYIELREELKKLGEVFHSQSDTEVLLSAYKCWGKDMLTKLEGMFAFAILDTQTGKVFLARDFFGIKPLYYCQWQNGFAFASEIKALLTLPGVSRQACSQSVYEYLRYNFSDVGQDTLFNDIKQLPAAHFMEVSIGSAKNVEPVCYWKVSLKNKFQGSFGEASEKLRDLFINNVQLHLRSDVPVGAALSGGIDSSAIVMAMRHLIPDLDIHTFSFISPTQSTSEEKWVDLVARAAKVNVHKSSPMQNDLVRDLDRLIESQDLPFGSASIYAQSRVFKLAAENGIKVMLDGQGADELFAGYPQFLSTLASSQLRKGDLKSAWSSIKSINNVDTKNAVFRALGQLVPDLLQEPVKKVLGRESFPTWINNSWLHQNSIKSINIANLENSQSLREELVASLEKTSLPMLLRYEDRNSMNVSIESRVPFLTPKMAEFAYSLPDSYLINENGTKAVLRKALEGLVPMEILKRRDKIGFVTPDKEWLTALRPWVLETLNSQTASQLKLLDMDLIKKECLEVFEGTRPFDYKIWRWLNLIRWADRFQVQF